MARQSDITTDNDTSYNRWFYAQFHRHVFRHRSHNMPSRVYVTVGCPSVRPSYHSRAAGLLLSAVRTGDIDRQRGKRLASSSNGAAARDRSTALSSKNFMFIAKGCG